MKTLRLLSLMLMIPAIAIVGYGVYLVAGGHWGREAIKAQLAIRTAVHSHAIRSGDGGDCAEFGTWNSETATCTITSPVRQGTNILFADNGITLDGGGHVLTGNDDNVALLVIDRSDVTIENLTLTNYRGGILLQHSTRTTIRNITIRESSEHAIHLTGLANYNAIVDNRIGLTGVKGHGVALWNSHGNFIAGNAIVGTRDAVRLQSSHGNTITRNLTAGSRIEGIDLHLSKANHIVFNDLMEATAVPVLDDMKAKGNRYSLASGGNHYKQFSLPDQGCDDGNKDGYCDNAYRFFREGVDARPSIRRWTSIDANNLGFPSSAFEVEIPSAVCTGCHFLNQDTEEEQAAVGPDIRSILGQPVAGEVGYAYSEALKGIGGEWTEQRLHRFLASPQAFSPGTTMVGVSIADHDLRQRIIDDLTTLAR